MLEAILWFTCNKISRVLYKRERKREKGGNRSFVLGFHASFFSFSSSRSEQKAPRTFERELRKPDGRWQWQWRCDVDIARYGASFSPVDLLVFFFFSIAADRRAISLVTLELGDLSERENIMRPPLVYACLYSFSLSKSVRVLHR